MASLPSPTQVAGTHSSIYEAYYHQVDPNGTGAIQALDAARFLKKSRLSDVVLSKIWDLSDPNGKGYLDKAGLFVALKLVALAQAGKDINMSNIHSEAPPPKVGELPKVPPPSVSPMPAMPLSDWSIKPAEREKYSQLFDSLQPNNGFIAGNKVKGVLMESKLPLDTLGKIWDLADQDKDGMLDRHEFIVAMHLVYKALEKHAVPTTLPPELRARPPRPPSRPLHDPLPAPIEASLATAQGAPSATAPYPEYRPVRWTARLPPSSTPASSQWISSSDRVKYDTQFTSLDTDRDGFVSGAEIRHVLLETGLPQTTLAHIWALCDTSSSGKLSRAQFAAAMCLVQRSLQGTPPPAVLPPDLIPAATMAPPVPAIQPIPEPVSLGPQPTPEMDAIARDVDSLARERLSLEAEVANKQKELTVKTGEADSLQSELDTLTATLKQLENQKGEAQKRLNDLKSQVEKLRSQVSAQEAAAAETEAEVAARRAAANTLKEKERSLQDETAQAQAEAEKLSAQLTSSVLAVSQANLKLNHLEEHHRALTAAIEAIDAGAGVSVLNLQPQFSKQHLQQMVRGSEDEDEEFSKADFSTMNGSAGFTSDPFKDDAFSSNLPSNDPFAPSNNKSAQDGFASDPFGGSADPFAGDSFASNDTNKQNDGAWESDPFAVLHAPTRSSNVSNTSNTSNPSNASNTAKRHKTPPPRPAPPRPMPPHKTERKPIDFTEDPFKDYRYEDPFNIEDPFADVNDKKADPFGRPTSVAGFEKDDFFSASSNLNGTFSKPERISGRVSAPPVAYDPFSKPTTNNDSWAAWPNDSWAADDAWSKPAPPKPDAWSSSSTNLNSKSDNWENNTDNWSNKTDNRSNKTDNWSNKTDNRSNKTDNWSNKTDNRSNKTDNWSNKTDDWSAKTDDWATDWGTDKNKNLNETWPSNTLPSKKEKSPKPVKYAKSLVHTIGGIGRTKQKDKKKSNEAKSVDNLPTEEQQWAWAAAESKRLESEVEARRRQEDAELQLALAISRQEK
ncbi:unnamed protein product [Pieris macdunnoughi]|uniref:Epidermal growth factor receptor substrate 15-like 1 n=1 Tax=Pieris macdunnoughi TaxID=345717 RepID=A0A821TWI3_9NEOP|nr:unnamed protein product [Pieris macdunnoughi]